MRIVLYALVGGTAAVVSLVISIALWRLSIRYRLYPKAIRARDVHTRPTPRLGGVAMFLGIAVAFAVASRLDAFRLVFTDGAQVLAILGAALVVVVVGVIDDLIDLDWTIKLAAQIVAAAVLVFGGVQLFALPIGGISLLSPNISLTLTVLSVVLVMNAINFIDGLDGLVAGVTIIANLVFFLYAYSLNVDNRIDYFNLASLIAVTLGGACAGFLVLNWHPAKLFMGDAGALLTGLLMATSAISVTTWVDPQEVEGNLVGRSDVVGALIPIVLPFAILVVPLLDFGLAVLRRLRAGKSPFSADRQHLHHRLLDMGHSHLHAVLIFYAWTTVVAVGCLLPLFVHWGWAIAFVAAGLVVASIVTLLPLTRRKAVEQLVQSARPDVVAGSARYDPLDRDAARLDEEGERERMPQAEYTRLATGAIPIVEDPT